VSDDSGRRDNGTAYRSQIVRQLVKVVFCRHEGHASASAARRLSKAVNRSTNGSSLLGRLDTVNRGLILSDLQIVLRDRPMRLAAFRIDRRSGSCPRPDDAQ